MSRLACAFVFALAGALTLVAAEPVTVSGRAMGTTWSAKFFQPSPPAAPLDPAVVSTQLAARLEALEAIFSTYRPTSELSRFNTSATTDWQSVSPELARAALDSHRLSELTAGAFDATIAPLLHLWGFGPQRRIGAPPTAAEISTARARVDYRHLEIRSSPPALRKTAPDLSADFSSMAKGFASDELSALLTSLGAPDHLVQVGGDLRAGGTHAWRTGIEQPALSAPASAASSALASSSFAALVTLTGQALSTSGNTKNFRTFPAASDSTRHGHLIDPHTGRPATSTLVSVSVIAATCAESSSLATALYILGPDAGYRFASAHHLAALFLIREDHRIVARPTPEFDRFSSASNSTTPLP